MQEPRRSCILHPASTRSHKNFFMAIAENLAQRNHTVTFVTNFNSTHQRPNIREIFVAEETFSKGAPSLFNTSTLQVTRQLFPSFVTSCSQTLASEQVQSILREEFDLVMTYISFTECFLPLIHERKVPFIYVLPNVVNVGQSDLAGTPFFPSLKATYFHDLEYPLTFTGRMISSLSAVFEIAVMNYLLSRQEAECRARKLCPEDMPSLAELRLKSSLFITNSVRTMENPTLPYTPTVVHAGGIHCRPAEPLPEAQEGVAEGVRLPAAAGPVEVGRGRQGRPSPQRAAVQVAPSAGHPRFREEAQRRARVMRDQPLSPGDWTTYWVEYVLRHQGARHLCSTALDIPWYQFYNADVWALVVVVTLVAGVLASWLCCRILRALIGCCYRARKTKKD